MNTFYFLKLISLAVLFCPFVSTSPAAADLDYSESNVIRAILAVEKSKFDQLVENKIKPKFLKKGSVFAYLHEGLQVPRLTVKPKSDDLRDFEGYLSDQTSPILSHPSATIPRFGESAKLSTLSSISTSPSSFSGPSIYIPSFDEIRMLSKFNHAPPSPTDLPLPSPELLHSAPFQHGSASRASSVAAASNSRYYVSFDFNSLFRRSELKEVNSLMQLPFNDFKNSGIHVIFPKNGFAENNNIHDYLHLLTISTSFSCKCKASSLLLVFERLNRFLLDNPKIYDLLLVIEIEFIENNFKFIFYLRREFQDFESIRSFKSESIPKIFSQ